MLSSGLLRYTIVYISEFGLEIDRSLTGRTVSIVLRGDGRSCFVVDVCVFPPRQHLDMMLDIGLICFDSKARRSGIVDNNHARIDDLSLEGISCKASYLCLIAVQYI